MDKNHKLLFNCTTCNQSFSTRGIANRHAKTSHHNSSSFNCVYCDYKASRHDTLKLHLAKHERQIMNAQKGTSQPVEKMDTTNISQGNVCSPNCPPASYVPLLNDEGKTTLLGNIMASISKFNTDQLENIMSTLGNSQADQPQALATMNQPLITDYSNNACNINTDFKLSSAADLPGVILSIPSTPQATPQIDPAIFLNQPDKQAFQPEHSGVVSGLSTYSPYKLFLPTENTNCTTTCAPNLTIPQAPAIANDCAILTIQNGGPSDSNYSINTILKPTISTALMTSTPVNTCKITTSTAAAPNVEVAYENISEASSDYCDMIKPVDTPTITPILPRTKSSVPLGINILPIPGKIYRANEHGELLEIVIKAGQVYQADKDLNLLQIGIPSISN